MTRIVIADAKHPGPQFDRWLEDLETRHLANLRFAEVTRALRALSSGYVERRDKLSSRSPFAGAGKRAAYALFYGPLHFLTVRAIVERLEGARRPLTHLADWGCGTGAGGAAWASGLTTPPRVTAVDLHPWALTEAAATYRVFGLDAEVRKGNVTRLRVPGSIDAVFAGWLVNEVTDSARQELLPRLLELAARGVRVMIVEPIATTISPWWPQWAEEFQQAGGQADEWRFRMESPALVRRLDHAAGLRHHELTARSLWLGG